MHELVQALLSFRKCSSSKKLRTVMCNCRVYDQKLCIAFVDDGSNFFYDKFLMRAVERLCNDDLLQCLIGIQTPSFSYMVNSLGSERAFCVDVYCASIQPA